MSQNDVYTEPPPKPADVPVRLYSNPICPYAQRVRLILAAKNISSEEVNIHLKVKPEWFLSRINPYGQVPVLEHEGKLIRESLVAFDYVDEVFGDSSLWPTDPYQKAMGKVLINDFGNKFTPNYYKYFFGKADENTSAELVKFISRIEDVLREHKEGFLNGESAPGAVDYLLWPWIERLGALKILKPELATVFAEDKFPVFYRWVSRMKQTDPVKRTIVPDDRQAAFIRSAKETGKHDYSQADLTGKGVTIYTRKEE